MGQLKRYQILPKTLQVRSKWFADSTSPHPATQRFASAAITSRLAKLSLVGSLFWISRHAKTKTFKGTFLCQTQFETTEACCSCELVRKRYTPHTEYWLPLSNYQFHESAKSTCTYRLVRKVQHSLTNSSSQANKRRLHHQSSLPSSQPKTTTYATETHLSSAKSKSRLNLTQNSTSPNHLSSQKYVFASLPTLLTTFSLNQLPPWKLTSSRILTISFHQLEPPRPPPPSFTRPLYTSYLATYTQYNNPPSPPIHQHHFPNSATLNSPPNLLPPYSNKHTIETL